MLFNTMIGNNSTLDTSDATATASDIYKGKTAYVNNKKIIGTHVCKTNFTKDSAMLGINSTIQAYSVATDGQFYGYVDNYYNNKLVGIPTYSREYDIIIICTEWDSSYGQGEAKIINCSNKSVKLSSPQTDVILLK